MRKLQHRWIELPSIRLFGADGENDPNDPKKGAKDEGEGKAKSKGDGKPVEDKFSLEYVEKLRKEAASRRVSEKETAEKLATVAAELAEIKKAEMSDLDKVKTELEEATERADLAEKTALQSSSQLKTERIRNAVTMAAFEAGFEDPTDALSMISQDDLVDDEGTVLTKTIKARLKSLGDKKPYLLKKNRPGSGDGGGLGSNDDPKSFDSRKAAHLKQMTDTGGRVVVG